MKLFALVTILVGVAVSAAGQQAPKPSPGLTISDVQDMVKGGLSEDLVIAALRKENRPFDLSATEMIQLRKSGISDNIIKVMLDPKAQVTPLPAAGSAPAGAQEVRIAGMSQPSGATPSAGMSDADLAANANNPDAPHDSGIYLYAENQTGQLKQMIPLERAATEGTKTGVLGHVLTYGIVKGKTKAVIPGPKASVRSEDLKPIFYFYFEDKSAALGKSHSFGAQTVSNPDQFSIVKFEEKKDSREVVIGTIGFASASSGSESKETIPFKSERVRPGVYRVIPVEDLKPGEYAFISASPNGAAGAADIFDFGVKQNQ
ncbi:MAG TPA: hypothetical protein VMU19_11025 [Bryobacteraceae bacterium]|nr:hypothetical protein [Bryobacteraceae bacterium]